MSTITTVSTRDVRFPTSQMLDGSDAMNADPDYSAAYVRVETDAPDGLTGDAFVFTIGRGNDVEVAALDLLAGMLVGRDADELLDDMGGTWCRLVHDSQLRWLGPEKGVMHMAIGAVVNALWDLKAKRAGLPLWALLSRMSPDELVALVDFRYLTDALTPQRAREILLRAQDGRAERTQRLVREGYPAYTTTPGWLGYSDDKLAALSREAVRQGFGQIKLKVGRDLDEDRRRLRIAREAVGPNVRIAVDANQAWDVDQAIDWIGALGEFAPAWVEEPTSPDDVVGHAAIAAAVAPIPIATGEHAASRVVFKQLLQLHAAQIVQIDATRVAGVNENVATLLLAADAGVPVCPHAGGVGLCEAVQHLAMFDFVAVSRSVQGRMIEYVDHLHEHFVTPVDVHDGRYWPPSRPGAGFEMLPASLERHRFGGDRA